MSTYMVDVYRGSIFRMRLAMEATGPMMALLTLCGHRPLRRVNLHPGGVLTAVEGEDNFVVMRCDDEN